MHFFSFSLIAYHYDKDEFVYQHAFRSQTPLPPPYACCPSIHNPLVLMSNLALLLLIAVQCSIRSPASSNYEGSTCTSWHTSDKNFAVKSITSLWPMLINPLVFQHILCWIVNIDPQADVAGKFATDESYRNFIPSQNCCSVRSNPFFTTGSTNNQFDTPFF